MKRIALAFGSIVCALAIATSAGANGNGNGHGKNQSAGPSTTGTSTTGNHGSLVRVAAHTCPKGKVTATVTTTGTATSGKKQNHGQCVRKVAMNNHGHASATGTAGAGAQTTGTAASGAPTHGKSGKHHKNQSGKNKKKNG
jgi:hypothetical protein